MEGFVASLNVARQFGHIIDRGNKYFFHEMDLRGLELNEQLLWRVVEFDASKGRQGPRALNVRPVK